MKDGLKDRDEGWMGSRTGVIEELKDKDDGWAQGQG